MNKLLNLFPDREFIFLDGGMGTMLQKEIDDIGKVPEVLNITHPEIIQKIQRAYVEAGSDIINTCTFGVNPYKIEGCGYTAEELIRAAVANARKAAEGTQTRVALDIGPLGRLLEPNGSVTFEEAYELFKRQILAGSDADLITIETMTDLYEMKAALLAAKENTELPVICHHELRGQQKDLYRHRGQGYGHDLRGHGG